MCRTRRSEKLPLPRRRDGLPCPSPACQRCRPQIALEIDGVSAILDLVADGAGCAILSRNAVMHSIRPSAYATRAIAQPQLRIGLSVSISSQRPSTLTQQAAMTVLEQTAKKALA